MMLNEKGTKIRAKRLYVWIILNLEALWVILIEAYFSRRSCV